MPNIISASRRTDIPAYFAEWLLRRLDAGFCDWWHPFSRQQLRVSLLPEDVIGIVLWTKNIGPLLPSLPRLRERYVFYVQFTITGHPRALERNVIPTQEAVAQARELARALGPESVVWRFDPIVHTQYGGPQETLARFDHLSGMLEGASHHCIISFMSPYRRQERAFAEAGLQYEAPTPSLRLELAARIADIAAGRGFTVAACCNDDVAQGRVLKAHCVDAERLRALGATVPQSVPAGPSRDQCGCARSVDIGAYDLCGGGCAYCYANQDHELALRNLARHDPGHLALAEAYVRGG